MNNMSIQSRQALRLIKFVSEMKKNHYPNAANFSELLCRMDIEENLDCACSPRTVARDIKILEEEYLAPIGYDKARNGYYLKNRDWDFGVPILADGILDMTLLGTRLASDILPEPLKGDVDAAVEKSLTGNCSNFFDEAMLESLLCATTIKAAVDPKIFRAVFEGWRKHQVLSISYRKPNEGTQKRRFEPHIIAFHRGVWYTKGYEYGTKNVKCYAIQRIESVAFGIDTFDTNRQLVEDTRRNGLFEYPKVDGVQLRCDAEIAFYLYEHQKMKKFKIERQKDGSLIITLRPAVEHEVIRWVLGEGGHIEVLYPPELRQKVAEAGKRIVAKNS